MEEEGFRVLQLSNYANPEAPRRQPDNSPFSLLSAIEENRGQAPGFNSLLEKKGKAARDAAKT